MKYTKLFTFAVSGILTLCLCACGTSYDDEEIDVSNNAVTEQKSTVDKTDEDNTDELGISLTDSDFIGTWEITDLPVDELDPNLFGDDTIVIKKDGTYQCGNVTAKLSNFWFIPGAKEKGAYKNTEKTDFNSYSLQDYGELNCTFFTIASDDGAVYPFDSSLSVKWENEKHTEATLEILSTSYGSLVEIKKK